MRPANPVPFLAASAGIQLRELAAHSDLRAIGNWSLLWQPLLASDLNAFPYECIEHATEACRIHIFTKYRGTVPFNDIRQ
jgi:hypothetical protein